MHANQVAGAHHVGRLAGQAAEAVGVEVRPRPFHALPVDALLAACAGQDLDAVAVDAGDDRRLQAAEGALLGELGLPAGQVQPGQALFGAAVAVALVIGQQPFAQRPVGSGLQVAAHAGVDAVAFGVGVAAEAADDFGAGHFRHVGGFQFRRAGGLLTYFDRFGEGALVALLVDLAQFVHARENPVAADLGAFGVDHRVVARGSLGQAGDHRQLGQRQFADRLAVVDLRGRLDAVGAVAEVDLVDVQLEDRVLVEGPLDLQGEKYLVDFPGKTPLVGEEEVLRHLHGDGAAAGLDLPALQ
ncbi:hypothetical protein D3C78_510260 [compost metagenome]